MDAKKIAQKLRDKLRKYEDFIGLYLYGSHAKGTAAPDSDVDIVGVFKINLENSTEVHGEALEVELIYDAVIDFQPMTLDQLDLDWMYFDEIKKGFYYAR